jgi:hypothetical protein
VCVRSAPRRPSYVVRVFSLTLWPPHYTLPHAPFPCVWLWCCWFSGRRV